MSELNLDLGGVSNVISGDKINEGVFIQLVDAGDIDLDTGEPKPRYLDPETGQSTTDVTPHPQRVKVRSWLYADLVKRVEAQKSKTSYVSVTRAKKGKARDEAIANSILQDDERFCLVLVGLDNIGAAPGYQELTPSTAKIVLEHKALGWLVRQAREGSQDDGNFLSDAEIEAREKAEAEAARQDELGEGGADARPPKPTTKSKAK